MIRRICTAPYPWLPAAVFAFFILCFAFSPYSPFTTHHLADPDDYMRLNEVISWLNGQNWYDLSAPRLSPGAHTVIHWSRLVDLPIALIALPFIPLLGTTNAVFAGALIVPLIWFAVLLALLPALARPLIGKDDANLSCVMVLFAPMLLFNYTPGRVDHHGIQAIIAGFALLCLNRIILNDRAALFAALAAAAFACGFWIGTEALPWAMVFITCLGIASAIQGKDVARNAAIFGICLPLFTTALIPAALPASEFSSRALSWFSPAYALFSALSGSIFIVGWLIEISLHKTGAVPSPLRGGLGRGARHKHNALNFIPHVPHPIRHLLSLIPNLISFCAPPSLTLPSRGREYHRSLGMLVLYALLAFAAGLAFFALIPSALQGPFADYDAFDATTALDNITEAQPLINSMHFNRFMPITLLPAGETFLRLLALPLIALIVCLWSAKRARENMRLVWFIEATFLLTALVLTLFWQNRVGLFMELFAIVPLTKLLCAGWQSARGRLSNRPLFWAEIGIFLALGFFPTIVLPALIVHTPVYPDLALFPVTRNEPACALAPVLAALNNSTEFGKKPLTIMNTSNTGPELLFATPHNVIAGNFDVPGNADSFTFFSATDDARAKTAAQNWHADLVLLCQHAPTLYLGKDYYTLPHMRIQKGQDGLLHMTNTDTAQPLIQRLIRGEIPTWLKPIELYAPSDYLLFKIQYPTE